MEFCIANYQSRILLKSVFLLAFGAFLRLGEILIRSPSDSSKVIQFEDVSISYVGKTPRSLTLMMHHYKHKKGTNPISITLDANEQNPQLCPVLALQNYIELFKPNKGPLFQFINGTPVTHTFVVNKLACILKFIGMNPTSYKGHSFRIGAATHAANLGFSETYIRKMGRWNSNAIHRYIKISSFHL